MAEKIRVELDNATGVGFDDITSGANKAGNAVDRLGDEAKQTAQQLDKTGQSGKSAFSGDQLANLVKFGAALAAAKMAIQGVASAVKSMSEEGSPAFGKLTSSANEVYGALVDIGNDPAVQEWINGMADSIKNDLIPNLKMVPEVLRNMGTIAGDTWGTMQQGLTSFIASSGEAMGVFAEGTA